MDLNLTISNPSRIYIKENGSCTLAQGSHVDYVTPEGKEVFVGTLTDGLYLEAGEYIIRANRRPCCNLELSVEELVELVEVPSSNSTVNVGDITIEQGADCNTPMNVAICSDANEVNLPRPIRNQINGIRNATRDSLAMLTEIRDLEQALKDSELNYTGRVVHDADGNHISNLVEVTYQIFDRDGNKTSWEKAVIDLDATGATPTPYTLATGEYLDFITAQSSEELDAEYIPVCVEREETVELDIYSISLPTARPVTEYGDGNRTIFLNSITITEPDIIGRGFEIYLDDTLDLDAFKTSLYQAVAGMIVEAFPSFNPQTAPAIDDLIEISFGDDYTIDLQFVDDEDIVSSIPEYNAVIPNLNFNIEIEDIYLDPPYDYKYGESLPVETSQETIENVYKNLGLKKIVTDSENNIVEESVVDINDTSLSLPGTIVECSSASTDTEYVKVCVETQRYSFNVYSITIPRTVSSPSGDKELSLESLHVENSNYSVLPLASFSDIDAIGATRNLRDELVSYLDSIFSQIDSGYDYSKLNHPQFLLVYKNKDEVKITILDAYNLLDSNSEFEEVVDNLVFTYYVSETSDGGQTYQTTEVQEPFLKNDEIPDFTYTTNSSGGIVPFGGGEPQLPEPILITETILGLKKIVTDAENNIIEESVVDINDTSTPLLGEIVKCSLGDTNIQYIPVCVEVEDTILFPVHVATLPISKRLSGGNRTSTLEGLSVYHPTNIHREISVELSSGMDLDSLKEAIYQALVNIITSAYPSITLQDIEFLEHQIYLPYGPGGDIEVVISDRNSEISENLELNNLISSLSFQVNIEDVYSDPALNDIRGEDIRTIITTDTKPVFIEVPGLKKIVTDAENNIIEESVVDINDTSVSLSGKIIECCCGSDSGDTESDESYDVEMTRICGDEIVDINEAFFNKASVEVRDFREGVGGTPSYNYENIARLGTLSYLDTSSGSESGLIIGLFNEELLDGSGNPITPGAEFNTARTGADIRFDEPISEISFFIKGLQSTTGSDPVEETVDILINYTDGSHFDFDTGGYTITGNGGQYIGGNTFKSVAAPISPESDYIEIHPTPSGEIEQIIIFYKTTKLYPNGTPNDSDSLLHQIAITGGNLNESIRAGSTITGQVRREGVCARQVTVFNSEGNYVRTYYITDDGAVYNSGYTIS